MKRGMTVPSPQLEIVTVRVAPDPVAARVQLGAVPTFEKSLLATPIVEELSVSVYVSVAAFVGVSEVVVNDVIAGPVRSTTTEPVELTLTAGAGLPPIVTVFALRRRPSVPSDGVSPGVIVTMYGPRP